MTARRRLTTARPTQAREALRRLGQLEARRHGWIYITPQQWSWVDLGPDPLLDAKLKALAIDPKFLSGELGQLDGFRFLQDPVVPSP